MNNNTLYRFMKEYVDKENISFHMPGHKMTNIYKKYGYEDFVDKIMNYDITEIEGADNLHNPEAVIKESQNEFAKLYGSKESYFLVNGTTSGIISAILACTEYGDKIIMARDCHKSVHNAVVLGDLEPIYVYSKVIEEFNVSGEFLYTDIEVAIVNNPQAKCVIIPYPNYYGVCSDIEKIVGIVHKHNKILIVDEAHGAHMRFTKKLPICAVEAGADIVINSIHKTLASFTQSSVLHVNGDNVNLEKLKEKLQIFQSSSPSYLLMTSLDICREIMEENGQQIVEELMLGIDWFYEQFKGNKEIKIMRENDEIKFFDRTKINIDMTKIGISGNELNDYLREDYGIHMEMAGANYCMGLCGIGNTRQHFEKLAEALEEIAEKYKGKEPLDFHKVRYGSVEQIVRPKIISEAKNKRVPLKSSLGEVFAKSVVPYPPGIPLICPGERITLASIDAVKKLLEDKISVLGITEQWEISIAILGNTI